MHIQRYILPGGIGSLNLSISTLKDLHKYILYSFTIFAHLYVLKIFRRDHKYRANDKKMQDAAMDNIGSWDNRNMEIGGV